MPWADASYGYKKKITIDHTKVSADVTDFPVYVADLDDQNIATVANGGHVQNTSGYDICFYDSTETTLLYHEIDQYAATGDVHFWVKTSLSSTNNTDIYMYYGKSGVTVNPSSTSTWDTDYVLVMHMKDYDATHIKDSTVNAYSGTEYGTAPTETAVQIGMGQSYNGTTASCHKIPDAGPLDLVPSGSVALTMEAWIKTAVVGTRGIITKEQEHSPYSGWCAYISASGNLMWISNGGTQALSGNTIHDNVLHSVAYVQTGASGQWYTDGATNGSATTGLSTISATDHETRIGCGRSSVEAYIYLWSGLLDEIRLSKTSRTTGWLYTCYANQSSPGTFLAVGTELTPSTAWTFTGPELLGLKDVVVVSHNFGFSVSEKIGLKEIASPVSKRYKTQAELLGLKEVSTAVKNAGGVLKTFSTAQPLGLKDIATENTKFIRTAIEKVGALETSITTSIHQRSTAELLGIYDHFHWDLQSQRTFNEKIGLIDVSTTSGAMVSADRIQKMVVVYSGRLDDTGVKEYVAAHFDLLDGTLGYPTQCAWIKANSACSIIVYYESFAEDETQSDWSSINPNDSWFLHTTDGLHRVERTTYTGQYAMNPNSSGYNTYFLSRLTSALSSYSWLDGFFLDDHILSLEDGSYGPYTLMNADTHVAFSTPYSDDIGDGYTDSVYRAWRTTQATTWRNGVSGSKMLMSNCHIDSAIGNITGSRTFEGFIHGRSTAYNVTGSSPSTILSRIDILRTSAALGTKIATLSGCSGGTDAQKQEWAKLCYAGLSFALSDVTNAFFCWEFMGTDPLVNPTWYAWMDDISLTGTYATGGANALGQPTGDYYLVTSPYIYAREFDNYYVVANLDSLGTGDKNFTFKSVSYTLSPRTAIFIKRATSATKFTTQHELIGMIEAVAFKKPVTAAEKLGLLETEVETRNAIRVFSELLGLKDTATDSEKYIRSAVELLGLLDAIQIPSTKVKTVSETLGLLELFSKVATRSKTYTESLGVLDSFTEKTVFSKTYSELLGVKDGFISYAVRPVISTELIGVKDTSTTTAIHGRIVTESLGLLDGLVETTRFQRTFTELLGLLDTRVFKLSKSMSEQVGLLDIATPFTIGTKSTSAAELLGVLDGKALAKKSIRATSENIGLTDVIIENTKFQRTTTELLGLLDAFQKSQTFSATIQEIAQLEEVSQAAAIHLFVMNIGEKLGVLDSKTTVGQRKRTFTELLGLKDTYLTNTRFQRTTVELLGLLDVSLTKETIAKTITELLGLKDIAATASSYGKSTTANELLGLLDTKTTSENHIRAASELLGLKDVSATETHWIRTTAELIGLLDTHQELHYGVLTTTANELLGVKDVSAAAINISKTYAESLSLLDVIATKTVFAKTVSELLGLKDISITSEVYAKTFTELLGLLDTAYPEQVAGKQVAISELLGLKETFSETGVFHITLSELLGLLDSSSKKPSKVLSELLGLKDGIITYTVFARSFADKIGLLDVKATVGVRFTTAAELLGLKETIGLLTRFSTTSTEKIGLLDSSQTVTRFNRTINENISMLDTAGIARWFLDIEKLGLIESASCIKNWVYINIGYLFEIDVYY